MEQLTDSLNDKLHVNMDRPAEDVRAVSSGQSRFLQACSAIMRMLNPHITSRCAEPPRGPGLADMPPELVEHILAVLPSGAGFTSKWSDSTSGALGTQQALSQTCRSLSEPSQRVILSKITLEPYQFREFLDDLVFGSACIKLGSFLRNLTIKTDTTGILTASDLDVLDSILGTVANLTELRIDVANLHIIDDEDQLNPMLLRDILEKGSFAHLTLTSMHGSALGIVPGRSLERLTLDFSFGEGLALGRVQVLTPPSPVHASTITIRNLVCEDLM